MEHPRSQREDTEPLESMQSRLETRKAVVQKVIEVVDLTES
jgi:hypothetical protein